MSLCLSRKFPFNANLNKTETLSSKINSWLRQTSFCLISFKATVAVLKRKFPGKELFLKEGLTHLLAMN